MRVKESSEALPAVHRGKTLQVIIDGKTVDAFEGETVATVLAAQGMRVFGHKDKTGQPRGIYCGMGICYECLVTVDGLHNVRACQTYIMEGMVIETETQVVL